MRWNHRYAASGRAFLRGEKARECKDLEEGKCGVFKGQEESRAAGME